MDAKKRLKWWLLLYTNKNSMITTFHKECISTEEADRIKFLAKKIAFELSFCGPTQIENTGCVKTTHTMIRGFNSDRAADVVENLIWRFLLDEEYGKSKER